MKRGPKPTPTALKLLKGVRPCRINENEPQPPTARPKKPAWLDKGARREWNRVCKLLESLGLLTELDGAVLGVYCQAFSRLRQAEDVIAKEGMTYTAGGQIKPRPEILIASKAMKIIQQIAGEFGMTPSARGRLEVPDLTDFDDEDLI